MATLCTFIFATFLQLFLSSTPRLSFSQSLALPASRIWWIFIFFTFASHSSHRDLDLSARLEAKRLGFTYFSLSLSTLFSCRVVIYSFVYLFICFLGCFLIFAKRGKLTALPFFLAKFQNLNCVQEERVETSKRSIRWEADMRDMCQGKKGDICYFVLRRSQVFVFFCILLTFQRNTSEHTDASY